MARSRVDVLTGFAKSRSPIAGSSRCVNLYVEKNPPGSPSPLALYPRPGYGLLKAASPLGLARGLYTASNGALYKVVGTNVYYVDQDWNHTLLGTIAFGRTMVVMADNGIDVLLVDGTSAGYSINLASNVMTSIIDPAFYGGDWVQYAGSCFLLNRPGTSQFYISGTNALTFDPLDFGQKTASPDPLIAPIALNNQPWLLGTLKGEVWYYTGAADFPFQQLPGVLIEHGCAAVYSPAVTDKFLFWLTKDKDGRPWIARGGTDYAVVRVSTHALENEIQNYRVWDDAIGYTKQQLGHTWYVINFPSADKTWQLNISIGDLGVWEELASIDSNGNLHRDRAQLQQYAYNTNVCVDWQTGNLLQSSPNIYKDIDVVYPCIFSFQHAVDTLERISTRSITADMEVGPLNNDYNIQSPWSSGFSTGFGPVPIDDDNPVFLRQSTNRGVSFKNARRKSLGRVGNYNKILRWWRCSMSRDSVYEISWALNAKTALQALFVDPSDVAET